MRLPTKTRSEGESQSVVTPWLSEFREGRISEEEATCGGGGKPRKRRAVCGIPSPPSLFFKIGNGPSGICLSYMLSGYRPYLSSEAIHPNTILQSKLQEARHLSLVDQVLFQSF